MNRYYEEHEKRTKELLEIIKDRVNHYSEHGRFQVLISYIYALAKSTDTPMSIIYTHFNIETLGDLTEQDCYKCLSLLIAKLSPEERSRRIARGHQIQAREYHNVIWRNESPWPYPQHSKE